MNDKHDTRRTLTAAYLRDRRRTTGRNDALRGAILTLMLLLLSGGAALAQSRSRPVVMSFNLHGGNSNQYRGSGCDRIPTDLSRFRQVIRQQRATVVLAQEIHRKQADDLARSLGFPRPYFVWTKTCRAGRPDLDYGNAILSRYVLSGRRRYALHTAGPDASRSEFTRLAAATVVVNGRRIRLYNTHLTASGTEADRNQQVADILRIVPADRAAARAGQRTILGGDFNFTPNSTPYQRLVTLGLFADSWAVRNPLGSGSTAPAAAPTVRIDYVLFGDGSRFGVGRTAVVDICRGNVCISDHRPVLAEVIVR